MANFNANAAGAASASLIIESQRQQVQQPAAKQTAVAVKGLGLSEGDQVSFSAYTVKKGDTLWDIAGAKLGDANKWPVLFALNREQIKNPDLIFPGQVLTVPEKVAVAPEQPKPELPNPVDSAPAAPPASSKPVQPEPKPPAQPPAGAVEEEIISRTPDAVPIAAEPVAEQPVPAPVHVAVPDESDVVFAPSQPAVPDESEVVFAPAKPTPAVEPQEQPQPVAAAPKPKKPLLRHPSELPAPYDPEPIVVSEPAVTEPATEPEPIAETPAQPDPEPIQKPTPQVPTIVGEANRAQASSGIGKAALVGGAIGAAGTGVLLVGLTRSIGSNLGGYATAQVVAKGINSVTSKIGFKVPAGPALSKIVSKIGGPKVAGAVTAVAAGAVVAGVAAGGYYLYKKATSDGDAPSPQPSVDAPSPQPAQVGATAPAEVVDAENPLANLQPVLDPNGPAPVDLSAKFQQLETLLDQKQYMFFGKITQPEEVRATGVQLWLEGNIQDRVKLATILVDHNQAELLGRVMAHEETKPLEIAQVMSQPEFPVQAYMNGLDDNQAFLVLNSLSSVAAMGESSSASVISQTIQGYDRMLDREAPFERLKNHHVAQGSWETLPANLRSEIDQLLK